MNIVKATGLAVGGLCKASGIPFISEFSMLIEEMASGINEMKESIQRIESTVNAQVLGNAEAAKIALQNSLSDDLSVDEKFSEIRRASHLYEKCYADLSGIPHLLKNKGDVAFCLGMCHFMLGKRRLGREWLEKSTVDFEAYIALPPKQTFVENATTGSAWAATKAASAAGGVIAAFGITTGGVGFAIAGAVLFVGGLASEFKIRGCTR
jgi:hypothetical protein